ncbi:MAG: heavy-metal-associated domain-containing protein [Sphingobium sp.]|nr:heavy-metal-associated domain-containing protein [Sphingobium sp.]MBP6112920.1 heavy-metal-associated domain-containing protein [Sphingobium sp.]MBP8670219.1 heavy-metal-associated domain-containing protein [Sphingobium sp.]MBP9157253.1 heavy-metal-associated domain-containing protein [Sphingobium sp.]
MTVSEHLLMPLRLQAWLRLIMVPLVVGLGLLAAHVVAQMEGERGVPPIASSGDFEVGGIHVDVNAPNAEAARTAGWRLAQRLAWKKLWAQTNGGALGLSDSQLDQIVSGIEVESEQIGPNRYIADLRVLFDRARAGQILGVNSAAMRSPPLLVIPILRQSGASTVFESINEWQKAWARYHTGNSAIDYVRTSGSGPDALLLNAGQIERRGRNWWRNILDQYGAADVVFPIARLERQWPGGPVIGRFAARYGPDNRLLGEVTLRVESEAALPKMLDQAIEKLNAIYTRALLDGRLRPDPSLVIEEPLNATELDLGNLSDLPVEGIDLPAAAGLTSYSIQFETPDVASVAQGEAALRAIAGVRSATTSSLALGGVSVMQVSYEGSYEMLRAGLQARGYSVSANGTTLRISRRGVGATP